MTKPLKPGDLVARNLNEYRGVDPAVCEQTRKVIYAGYDSAATAAKRAGGNHPYRDTCGHWHIGHDRFSARYRK